MLSSFQGVWSLSMSVSSLGKNSLSCYLILCQDGNPLWSLPQSHGNQPLPVVSSEIHFRGGSLGEGSYTDTFLFVKTWLLAKAWHLSPNSMMHLNIVRQLFGLQYLLSSYEPLVPPAETLHTSDLPYLMQQIHRVLQKSFSGGACVSLIFLLFLLVRSVLWSWQKKRSKRKTYVNLSQEISLNPPLYNAIFILYAINQTST